ncbi:TonB-dependent receptor [Paraferrimonas haliotis]|uniref:TonB-dependent receptor n=1 Tax=Paraferrimonas haliotis TaxID=2013866 RepID=A0AA37TMY3_9GAMM|nr:TonB-dependent receptor [Paraferrimonas haliotis]GLS84704.1 TonB-dependent receptor [Paraferrimonas haliotis]
MKTITKAKLSLLSLTIGALVAPQAYSQTLTQENESAQDNIERILVTSDYRQLPLAQVPSSVSVVDQQTMKQEGQQHFQETLQGIANINWSGGSSRPRYFQIRGVGEQEEYQGAPNSSVGFIVDDIDLSGIGMTASLFDMQQVEVLRGPQGTRYGANALAGLIYMKSNDPTYDYEHGLEASVGQDDLLTLGGYTSGRATDDGSLLYRFAIQQHSQNGFVENSYLNRNDTNKRDELSVRGKMRWLASDDLSVDLTLMGADFDNGYDVWTLDNNGFTSLTDQPGVDSQKTYAGSVKLSYSGAKYFELVSLTSVAKSDQRHAYDGDWANPDYWAGKTCEEYDDDWNVIGSGPCQYDYWWDKQAKRDTVSQELRFSSTQDSKLFAGSTDWLVGVYGMNLNEDNDLYSEYNGYPDQVLQSSYEATNLAVFGQLDTDFGQGLSLSTGLRFERRSSEYSDSDNEAFDPTDNMWGGHIALSKAYSDTQAVYGRIARGYKAGGFNMGLPAELAQYKTFDPETLYNYEIGLNSQWFERRLSTSVALFYMDRQDQQVEASQQDPDNPQRFTLYTANATSSTSYGAEFEFNGQLSQDLSLYGSLGLLNATYDDYQYKDSGGNTVDLSGRELAHAPSHTYSLGLNYLNDWGWFANINTSGKSKFYYSDSHDSQSKAYGILNAKVGYQGSFWSVSVWGRNLTDERYGTRGFYFGNEPDNGWTPKQYIRYGDPRHVGVTFSIDWI